VRAIIAEIGGITSHGANLAREYKIPCFNLAGAAKILKEGQKINILPSGKILLKKEMKRKFKPILTTPKVLSKKHGWYLTQTYARSPLESFLEKEGIKITPKVLFGRKLAKYYFDKSGLRWVRDFPMPDKIAKKIIQDEKWFFKKVRERKKLYKRIRKYTRSLVEKLQKKKLDLSKSLAELEKIRKIYIARRPYTALTQHPLDFVEEDFHKLAAFLPKIKRTKLFDAAARTEYAKALARLKNPPPSRQKTIVFPGENLTFIKAEINYRQKLKLSKEIKKYLSKKPKAFQKEFKRYCEAIFLLTKLSDETAYLRQTLGDCLIKILEKIADYLLEKKKISKKEEVLKFSSRPSFKFKGGHEILTKFDLASEKIIFKTIRKIFPKHDILSEEAGYNDFESKKFLWICDPLDGTTNFSMKNPLFAVSIALAAFSKIVFGAVYIPVLKEIFWAKKGGGAYLNNKRIFVSRQKNLRKSFLTYCHGSKDIKNIKRAIRAYNYFKLNAADARQLGSAAAELAWVACGRTEAIMIPGVPVWDVAAGLLLVREAGGVATDWRGKEWNLKSRDILASCGKIHQPVLKVLKKI
jgi:myo-inositol-1(or 4)-monophosphatase